MINQMEDGPFHIQEIQDLQADYTAEKFVASVKLCREAIAKVIAADDSSDQQIARVHMLRYLDRQLSRAVRWALEENDLMAVVLRSQIDLLCFAEFVSKGPKEAAEFLAEPIIDYREIHKKLSKAYPAAVEPLPCAIPGKRIDLRRRDDEEEYEYKLCSKLIHPSAVMLLRPEDLLLDPATTKRLAVSVLFHGWLILETFHPIKWTDSEE